MENPSQVSCTGVGPSRFGPVADPDSKALARRNETELRELSEVGDGSSKGLELELVREPAWATYTALPERPPSREGPPDPLREPSQETLQALDAHFDAIFASLRPQHASARHRRRRLAADLRNELEMRCQIHGCGMQAACSRAVLAAVRMHERYLDNAGSSTQTCVSSKYHNLLYVVAKLCFDCRLQDSDAVCQLLKAIFYCERTLENLIVGAILGVVCTNVLAGWKSDFDSRYQNLQALDYFLERAARGRLQLTPGASEYSGCGCGGGGGGGTSGWGFGPPCGLPLRLPELPLRSYCDMSPLLLAVLMTNADAVLLLLRHGARVSDASPLHTCLRRRTCDDDMARCVRILMRAVPQAEIGIFPRRRVTSPTRSSITNEQAWFPVCNKHYDVVFFEKGSPEAALVPEDRRGVRPPALKHLCRCTVRAALRAAWQLPFGIYALDIPVALCRYLDLLED